MKKQVISNLSESQLEAFYTISKEGSFSKAAKSLHVSQPALTRRLQSLEEILGVTLFNRTPMGIELLEAGHKLLGYVNTKNALESDVIHNICGTPQDSLMTGFIRIAGFSSLMEPVVLSTLQDFLLSNPHAQVELSVRTNSDLDLMLNYSKTDIILSSDDRQRKDVVQHLLGYEEYVCIESSTHKARTHVYLDGTPQDNNTFTFLEHQANPPSNVVRSFLHDENGILKGVQMGLGRAVKPKHLLKGVKGIKVVKGLAPLKKPVYLRYSKKNYYTALQLKVLDILLKEIPKHLKK